MLLGKVLFLSLFFTFLYGSNCTYILKNHIGWTIVGSKIIQGYKDRGKPKKEGFEGCDYDRVIYFTDGTAVTCNMYGYSYAYMPTAIILAKSVKYKGKNYTLYKMIVSDNEYDIR